MNRRQFLKATAATTTAFFAGCAANDNAGKSQTDRNARV
ncbi:MAG: twin-arginine translocation signal domain-containing protein [Planctomycetota bacterium]